MKKQRKKMPTLLKIVLIMSAFLLTADVVLGIVLINNSTNKMKTIIQNKIVEFATTAANLVNGEEIEQLTEADYQTSEAFWHNYNILDAFKTSGEQSNAELAYIYCVVKKQDDEGKDRYVFSIDPSDEPGGFLTEETIRTTALIEAFNGKAGFDTDSYVDRWGDLYSAYAPIWSNETNVNERHVCGIIGVDVWASWYKKEISNNAWSIAFIAGVTLLLGISLSVAITMNIRKRFDKLTLDMESLEDDVKTLIDEIRDPRYIKVDKEDTIDKVDSIEKLKLKIHSTQVEIKNYIEYTHEQAFLDALTGLGNRNAYYEVVDELDYKIKNGLKPSFSVIVFDINGLKRINDTFGHDNGDIAIINTGNFIKESFGEDCVYRIGGDEFVVVVEDVDNATITKNVTKLSNLLKEFNLSDNEVPFELTISYGCSPYDKRKDTCFSDAFKRADEEMYFHKNAYYTALSKSKTVAKAKK